MSAHAPLAVVTGGAGFIGSHMVDLLLAATDSEGQPLLEVFLFDFDETIYGHRVTVEFVHKLRDEEKYDTLDALTRQIRADVVQARDYFARVA